LNVVSVRPDDRATVLFPNQYHRLNTVSRGELTLPSRRMNFELVADGPTGTHMITAFLTRSPLDGYQNGFKTSRDVMAALSPASTRSLMLHQAQDWLAAGKVTVEIREKGRCK
jgi:hypothetical protein